MQEFERKIMEQMGAQPGEAGPGAPIVTAEPVTTIPASQTKRCSCCGQVKPIQAFGRQKGPKDGLRAHCKSCVAAKAREHYARNAKPQVAEYHKARTEESAPSRSLVAATKPAAEIPPHAYGSYHRPGASFPAPLPRLRGDGEKNDRTLNQKTMITKKIEPILQTMRACDTSQDPEVIGTQVEYRIFGLLFYRKTMHTPAAYGIKVWDFTHRI